MSYLIIAGGLIGSFAHLVLKDGLVKEGEIKAWQNWFVSLLAGLVAYGAYLVLAGRLLPLAETSMSQLGIGAFVGYALDSLIKKAAHWK